MALAVGAENSETPSVSFTESLSCPASPEHSSMADSSNVRERRQIVRLRNLLTGSESVDTLHQSGIMLCPVTCTAKRCMGSLMQPTGGEAPWKRPLGKARPAEETKQHAEDFLKQYYTSLKGNGSSSHCQRLAQVLAEIEERGTYELTEKELVFGAKTAWRNAVRCIGRIQWNKLQVFDCRHITTADQMNEAIRFHITFANNGGNIRSAITVFPQRTAGLPDFRVWNSQFFKYAGFKQPDGSVIGDPINVEFTDVVKSLGWMPKKEGPFVLLPLVLQARGEQPQFFEIDDLALEVDIEHPQFEWFIDLGLKWYCLPAVSNFLFDCGGLEFTASPFSGWYMGTEVGRDLCDENRYNILPDVAKRMGLNTRTTSTLWKDRAFLEVNVAILHSFQKAGVTITDHHNTSESFMKHLENECRLRGGCPTDWVWVTPPMCSSTTPVYHQEMLNYHLRPSYDYQDDPWKAEGQALPGAAKTRWQRFRIMAVVVQQLSILCQKSMASRVKATILYATETGRSATYAKRVGDLFSHSFKQKVVCMEDYNARELEHEQLVIVVASTFGNGEPPDNGREFENLLSQMCHSKSKGENEPKEEEEPVNDTTEDKQPLENVRFAVFGLGSRAYVNFCAFAKQLDKQLAQLGGQRLSLLGQGDELCGQEEAFLEWLKICYQAACIVFAIEECDNALAEKTLQSMSNMWDANCSRLKTVTTSLSETVSLEEDLAELHHKNVCTVTVLSVKELQAAGSQRSTILVKLGTNYKPSLSYGPGDHLAVCCVNDKQQVADVLKRVVPDVDFDVPVTIESCSRDTSGRVVDGWHEEKRFPSCCSVRHALTHFLDITSPPTPRFLKLIVNLVENSEISLDDQERLQALAKGSTDYEDWKFEKFPTLAEFLNEFKGLQMPASLLLTQLPILQPRFYSISSSPRLYVGEVHLTVAVVTYTTKGGTVHHGLCSTWLSKQVPGNSVQCFVRKAPSFHMPSDISAPVYMIGPGTGIAPFRSFWQHRYYLQDNLTASTSAQTSKKRRHSSPAMVREATPMLTSTTIPPLSAGGGSSCTWGRMKLFFGCRNEKIDNIYKKELGEYMLNKTLEKVCFAFSRDPKHPKLYVQNCLESQTEASQLQCALCDEGGHIYVCGDASMAADVSKTVQKILETHGAMSTDEAQQYMADLKREGRYHEDIFGVTLRTQEVTEQKRAAAKRNWMKRKLKFWTSPPRPTFLSPRRGSLAQTWLKLSKKSSSNIAKDKISENDQEE